MENASKALLMAATVLVGVLLLSLGVYLFTLFGNFGAETTEKLTQKNIDEFNARFYKYESYQDETGNWQNTCRAQDVVTLANLARENNKKYEYTVADMTSGYYYVRVIVKPKTGKTKENFEAETLQEYKDFMKKYSGKSDGSTYNIFYFKCTDILINNNSKRVCSITFEEL